ncbi:hypothetical protein [Bacillus thermotolerans]|mgnify:CR=1 FL=1|uniref:Uncharacterized protein n=1 Tax=Bacillus thermotolerans TaxID=1221996 RepID=A0A0F5HZ80_BACTR|nr:hypothetical protein [Bacillus thermotolerans]KKB34165.1 hypothetical protein QY96_00258 [Bacillus thermotolerans]KKB34428.1 hypothetical protein QY97_02501 [Bacillus thermotolerans]KKB38172.1 hypothetical protein QY95_02627 [Bacillus thermotolerans]
MNLQKEYVKKLAGIHSVARHKETENKQDSFLRPLVHKQIHGSEVYVPLDLERLWSR